ncbi:hypothetical protein JKP88DRAFT_327831 [Tribonema minus]|uniref:Wax synthase domain-containing protein n=1 Tax=Tribonema minus TaxID=303371 RepID=A0A835YQ75_9STRA|nr:hypothetical protein JKP88DRAFT_327831 [Tribonema minus]
MASIRDTYHLVDFLICGSCLRETLGVLLMLALPSVSCAFAPTTTIILVTGVYLLLPVMLGCFWSVLLWGVCSVLVFLRLLQASAEISRYRGRGLWFRALQLLSMHDLTASPSFLSSATPVGPALGADTRSAGASMVAARRLKRRFGAHLCSRLGVLGSMTLESLAFFGVGLAMWVSIPLLSGSLPEPAALAVRTAMAACCMIVWLDAIDAFLASAVMLAGSIDTPLRRTQLDPLQSLSLGEFWSRRWNTEMSTLLRTAVFRPALAGMRRARWLGWLPDSVKRQAATMMTFGMSGLLHAYVHALMGNASQFGFTMAFFLVQPCGIWVEQQLSIARWPKAAQRTWTICFLLLTFPLLSEPMQHLLPPDISCIVGGVFT